MSSPVGLDSARETLTRKLGVAGLLKLLPQELDSIPLGDAEFFHVNAAPCTHRAGSRYAAVAMTSSASLGAAQTLVDVSTASALECLEVLEYDSIQAIPPSVRDSLLGVTSTPGELEATLLRRYGQLRGWTAADVATRAVVVSRLRRAQRHLVADVRVPPSSRKTRP
jgi:hypothetical protein